MALLFDRVHLPGLSLPLNRYDEKRKAELRREITSSRHDDNYKKLGLWAVEQPELSDFLFLPDQSSFSPGGQEIDSLALSLVADTYNQETAGRVGTLAAAEMLHVPDSRETVFALTWPLYQARAILYAKERQLRLLTDDRGIIPPLPMDPDHSDTKAIAQQLAFEALALTIPKFKSVELATIPEFRSLVAPYVRPFRQEMIKFTADVHLAIASGAGAEEVRQYCGALAETRIIPHLAQLRAELDRPIRPWTKNALDILEIGLGAMSSKHEPALTMIWAVLTGTKALSEYVELYKDRQGKKRSGLSMLIQANDRLAQTNKELSSWDAIDWRCSGHLYIEEPGTF